MQVMPEVPARLEFSSNWWETISGTCKASVSAVLMIHRIHVDFLHFFVGRTCLHFLIGQVKRVAGVCVRACV